jgi:hypothetical protein
MVGEAEGAFSHHLKVNPQNVILLSSGPENQFFNLFSLRKLMKRKSSHLLKKKSQILGCFHSLDHTIIHQSRV